jgi:uncharacterized membrane protein
MLKWHQIFLILLVLGLLYYLFIAALIVLAAAAISITAFFILRLFYFLLNPQAKQRYTARKEAEKAGRDAEEAAKNRRAREAIERKLAERKKQELLRDAEAQDVPYEYAIGRHGNETLAIRYGIANLKKEIIPYFYHVKDGVKKRNPDRDKIVWKDSETIRLKKLEKIGLSKYEVQLSDFRDRRAVAIIEVGTDYVKTFYPIDEGWFKIHRGLEEVLKGNRSMSLKELAHFHVEKTISSL